MESLSSKNKNVKYLLHVIDISTKYAWAKPLKDKKCKAVPKAFIEKLNEPNLKANVFIKEKNFIVILHKNG